MLHFSPVNNLVVWIAVLYDLLWFINVNEQTIKKKIASVGSLLKEVETDHATEEPAEIMRINHDSGSKFEKSDEHEMFEMKGNFSNAT
ncbi:hypothetical protein TNCV_1623551 [Trichonephila clavipes]|nr:hypothetical protein TNCV_1623551 [Trichonephila clavipes]